jgi:5-methyltetrahydrofolate--homocysteine methyltransferase
MAGMHEVGRRFSNNELIVAEVLQSAEAMKTAVGHLEKFMDKAGAGARTKVLLATVKGDVHDIGKNLVEIIFKNNGYDVVNLGIKVPPDDLVRACRRHQPKAIGLSGLLVKSAQQMITTADDLRVAGIRVPLLVGGAALSEVFARTKIAPHYPGGVYYAKDAMTGLRILSELASGAPRDNAFGADAQIEEAHDGKVVPGLTATQATDPAWSVRADLAIPRAPFLDRRVRLVCDLQEIWSYVNPFMLYGRHMGFRENFERALAARDPRAVELFRSVEEIKREASSFMKCSAVWQFFEAERYGNSIALFGPGRASPAHTFHFQRQSADQALCLSDYILPPRDGRRDHLALFVVTAGAGIRAKSEQATAEGRYVFSHGLQALALESAEAAAEWLHRRIREDWSFPDPPSLSMAERFTAHYRGKRYSFGYPACPNLDDQQGIWALLKPEEIGVTLTEGMMMDPEASVSALVFHHLDCTYFSVGKLPDGS